jgi:hypothetical protein
MRGLGGVTTLIAGRYENLTQLSRQIYMLSLRIAAHVSRAAHVIDNLLVFSSHLIFVVFHRCEQAFDTISC